jgi:hypothetical protein
MIPITEADPLHLCPADDTLVITHPTTNNDTVAETRWRCGRPVQGGVVDVPPKAAPTQPAQPIKASPPPVRIVREVVVKKVYIQSHSHHRSASRGPFDFLFHHQ